MLCIVTGLLWSTTSDIQVGNTGPYCRWFIPFVGSYTKTLTVLSFFLANLLGATATSSSERACFVSSPVVIYSLLFAFITTCALNYIPHVLRHSVSRSWSSRYKLYNRFHCSVITKNGFQEIDGSMGSFRLSPTRRRRSRALVIDCLESRE